MEPGKEPYREEGENMTDYRNLISEAMKARENAAFTPTNCAERTAFFKGISEGVRAFRAIAIVGGKQGAVTDYTAPCGVCRQVMMEFCNPDTFEVIAAVSEDDYKVFKLKELMPEGFGPDNL